MAHGNGLTRMELALLLGFKCDELISKIENGECCVPLKVMTRLSDILNIHPNEFIAAAMKDREDSLSEYFSKKFKKKIIYM